jgi:hypothetical protein
VVLADAFQNPIAGDVAAQNHSDAAGTMYVNALMQRAQQDVALERRGELANGVVAAPAKRGLPLALEGALSLSMVLALAWVVVGVRR